MAFSDAFHPKFKSDLKKIDKLAAREIKEKHLDIVLNNSLLPLPKKLYTLSHSLWGIGKRSNTVSLYGSHERELL